MGCRQVHRKLPPLEETYRHDDKNPFGGYVAFESLLAVFDNVKIVYGNDKTIDSDTESPSNGDQHSLYVIIANQIYFPETEMEWALDYVKEGNDLFISANMINDDFFQKIGAESNQGMARLEDHWGKMQDTKVNIYFGNQLPKVPFGFYYYPFNNYLRKYQEGETRILGVNEKDLPDFAIIFIGKGRLYLHLAPRALSNYFLLTANNIDYFNHVVNYLRADPRVVYWDEYYKRLTLANENPNRRQKDFSSLEVVMKNPALKWAFWLAAAALLFFIFSNFKRKQRIIAKQSEPTNASVDFVETIGRLYFVNKDNKNIALKLITYFKESVRSKYFINVMDHPGSFAARLAGKKGLPVEQVQELLNCIERVEGSGEVADDLLLDLNQQLEKFYNKK